MNSLQKPNIGMNADWDEKADGGGEKNGLKLTFPMPDRPENITYEFAMKMAELIQLFDKKQKDYGKGNISEFGRVGLLVRINDKLARIKNLTQGGYFLFPGEIPEKEKNEPIRDSYMDMAVYTVIDWLVEEGIWDAS